MSKFKKIAKVPTKPGDFSEFVEKFFDPQDDLSKILNKQNIKNNLQFLAALFPGWTDTYSPSAFYHALETDTNRGYDNTQHSQGNYEMLSPELEKALEEFKKNPPKNLKDFVTDKPIDKFENINMPESSERYKAMREKLYPSAPSASSPTSASTTPTTSATPATPATPATSTANKNNRFVKTSQNSPSAELQKAMPKWTIETVLKDMARVQTRKDLNLQEKREVMANILSQYEKSIAPLSQYLRKNDIQYK
jgi:hypothetical protein